MARYFTDFADYEVGSVAGWTSRWVARTYAIVAEESATGGKVLRASQAINSRSLITWDAIDSDEGRADFEVLFRSSSSGASGSWGLSCGVSGRASDVGVQTGYVSTASGGALPQGHVIGRYVSGASTFPAPFAQAWLPNVFYWQRFRVNGASQQAKRWAGGLEDEPDDWQISETNSAITDPGWIGFFTFAGSGGINNDLDLIAIGTAGDTARIPSGRNMAMIRRRRKAGGGLL